MKLLTFEQPRRRSGSAHRREDAYKEGSYFERVKIFMRGGPQLLKQVSAAPGNDSFAKYLRQEHSWPALLN